MLSFAWGEGHFWRFLSRCSRRHLLIWGEGGGAGRLKEWGKWEILILLVEHHQGRLKSQSTWINSLNGRREPKKVCSSLFNKTYKPCWRSCWISGLFWGFPSVSFKLPVIVFRPCPESTGLLALFSAPYVLVSRLRRAVSHSKLQEELLLWWVVSDRQDGQDWTSLWGKWITASSSQKDAELLFLERSLVLSSVHSLKGPATVLIVWHFCGPLLFCGGLKRGPICPRWHKFWNWTLLVSLEVKTSKSVFSWVCSSGSGSSAIWHLAASISDLRSSLPATRSFPRGH